MVARRWFALVEKVGGAHALVRKVVGGLPAARMRLYEEKLEDMLVEQDSRNIFEKEEDVE